MPGYMSETVCLPIEVFEGGGGDLVLMQEFPALTGDTYLRLFVDMDKAEDLCAAIMRVARESRAK